VNRSAAALSVLALLLPLATSVPAAEAPAIAGDFEQAAADGSGPIGWRAVPPPSAADLRAELTWAEGAAHGGDHAVAIRLDPAVDGGETAYNWTTRVTDVEPGVTYALSGWMKCEDLTSTAALVLQCWSEGGDEMLAFATTEGDYRLTGTRDWTRAWTAITVPAETAHLTIRAVNAAAPGKGGAVWFDDLALHVVSDGAPGDAAASLDGPAAIAGTWHGELTAGGATLRLVLHVARDDRGWVYTLDSVDQQAMGLQVLDLDVIDGEVAFRLAAVPASYTGTLTAADRMEGQWLQGMPMPLTFTRLADGDAPPERPRPQTPEPPFPYASHDVAYRVADDVTLHGTLTVPGGEGPHPAVLLISGSGPQDRDETIFGHRPFLVLADHLSRHGLAVLRYDDRGTAESTGTHATATTADFADDATAGFRFLQGRPDIDPDRIALLGHSEGGLIAPLVAAAEPDVAAIVLMAGPGVPGREVLELQQRLILEASGATPEKIATARAHQETALAIATADLDSLTRAERLADHMRSAYAALSDEERAAVGDADTYVRANVRQLLTPWMRWFLEHDPAPVLREVRCPVLAVYGARDVQVDADQNLPAVAAALDAGGNPDHTEVVLPDLNHLMQTARTGGLDEYAMIEETLAPAFLDTVTAWLRSRLEVPRR
jgi:hypothetical protein